MSRTGAHGKSIARGAGPVNNSSHPLFIMNFRRWTSNAAVAMSMAWPSLVFACEGCKSSAQDGEAPNAIGEAYGLSIYFMLAVVAMVVGLLVRGIVRRCREIDREHAHLFPPAAENPAPAGFEDLGDAVPVR